MLWLNIIKKQTLIINDPGRFIADPDRVVDVPDLEIIAWTKSDSHCLLHWCCLGRPVELAEMSELHMSKTGVNVLEQKIVKLEECSRDVKQVKKCCRYVLVHGGLDVRWKEETWKETRLFDSRTRVQFTQQGKKT